MNKLKVGLLVLVATCQAVMAGAPWPVVGRAKLYVVSEFQALPYTVVCDRDGRVLISLDYFMDSASGGVKSAEYIILPGVYSFYDSDNNRIGGPWMLPIDGEFYLHIDKDAQTEMYQKTPISGLNDPLWWMALTSGMVCCIGGAYCMRGWS